MSKAKIPPEAYWTAEARKLLVGRKITDVSYMSNAEVRGAERSQRPLCIILDDGNLVFAMANEEGNNAGVLATNDARCYLILALRTGH